MAINKLRAFCNTNSFSSVSRRHDIDFLLMHTFDFNLQSISIILVRRSFDSSSTGIVFLDFDCCVISIVRIHKPISYSYFWICKTNSYCDCKRGTEYGSIIHAIKTKCKHKKICCTFSYSKQRMKYSKMITLEFSPIFFFSNLNNCRLNRLLLLPCQIDFGVVA